MGHEVSPRMLHARSVAFDSPRINFDQPRQGLMRSKTQVMNRSPLEFEIPAKYMPVVKKIAEDGWEKVKWANGFTLLHWAAKKGSADLCARFIAQRADPGHRDDTGRNALDYAKENDHLAVLAELDRSYAQSYSQKV